MTNTERKDHARALRAQGMSAGDIARWLGTPKGLIWMWLDETPEPTRPRAKRQDARAPVEPYRIADTALALALSGVWR